METSEKAADKSIYERLLHDLANNDKVLHEVRVGKRVGLYRIRGVLGTGSFAQVKLGFHVLCESKTSSYAACTRNTFLISSKRQCSHQGD